MFLICCKMNTIMPGKEKNRFIMSEAAGVLPDVERLKKRIQKQLKTLIEEVANK